MRRFVFGALCATLLIGTTHAADTPPSFNWTGFYIGLDVGGLDSKATQRVPLANAQAAVDPNGLVGGAHLGYLWQMNPYLVLGVEADIWSTNADGEAILRGFANYEILNLNWGASLRGIVGVPVSRALLYATGGVSFIDIDGCTTAGGVPGACAPVAGVKFDDRLTGWTIGAGLAYAITPQFIARVEYLYADYGHETYSTPPVGGGFTSVDLQTHTVRAGLSYRFATR